MTHTLKKEDYDGNIYFDALKYPNCTSLLNVPIQMYNTVVAVDGLLIDKDFSSREPQKIAYKFENIFALMMKISDMMTFESYICNEIANLQKLCCFGIRHFHQRVLMEKSFVHEDKMIWFQNERTNNNVFIPSNVEYLNIVNGVDFDNIPNTIRYLHIGLEDFVTLNNLPTSLITLNISAILPLNVFPLFDKSELIENIRKNIIVPFGCELNIICVNDILN